VIGPRRAEPNLLVNEVYGIIHEAIISGDLPAGSRLKVRDLIVAARDNHAAAAAAISEASLVAATDRIKAKLTAHSGDESIALTHD
jgi:hypothetical protein